MIERLADAGIPVDRACRALGVARQNYYLAKRAPTTKTQLRRQWLTGLIREVHVASRGTPHRRPRASPKTRRARRLPLRIHNIIVVL